MTIQNRIFDKLLEKIMKHVIYSDNIFAKLITQLIDSDRGFNKLLEELIASDKGFNKIKSLIGESNVGKNNQLNREKWLEKTLKDIPPNYRLLDAGAGEMQYKKFCNHLQYVSQDFAKYDGCGNSSALQPGKWDQANLDIISDITSIPEPDASFDVIMCIEVFEHLPDPVIALKEFSRLLRVGGILIITAPFCSLTHFAPYHFSTGFNRYFYETHLPIYGFKISEITPNGNYFEFMAQENRRSLDVAERYAHDKPTRDEILGLKITLRMLDRFSSKDNGSNELLAYGYHVRAEKNT